MGGGGRETAKGVVRKGQRRTIGNTFLQELAEKVDFAYNWPQNPTSSTVDHAPRSPLTIIAVASALQWPTMK